MNTHAYAKPPVKISTVRPLCVDLDGTLVKSDTLIDSLLLLLRTRPVIASETPFWVFQGKAAFKEIVTSRSRSTLSHLPYNRPLRAFLRREDAKGRDLYLATGADGDGRPNGRTSRHIRGRFGSDGRTNLTGDHKLGVFGNVFTADFDYVGNAQADLPLLAQAIEPMVANPASALNQALKRSNIAISSHLRRPQSCSEDREGHPPPSVGQERTPPCSSPVSHTSGFGWLLRSPWRFSASRLTASSAYIVNDLLDIEADRRHPKKRARPFAAGDLPAPVGIGLAVVFLAMALTGPGFCRSVLRAIAGLSGNEPELLAVSQACRPGRRHLASGLYAIRLLAGALQSMWRSPRGLPAFRSSSF